MSANDYIHLTRQQTDMLVFVSFQSPVDSYMSENARDIMKRLELLGLVEKCTGAAPYWTLTDAGGRALGRGDE